MTTRSENQSPVFSERLVVFICSDGVCALFLFGKGYQICNLEHAFHVRQRRFNGLLKRLFMLRRNSEVNVDNPLTGSIQSTFHQMLNHRFSVAVWIGMKSQQTFGQTSVVQTFGCE